MITGSSTTKGRLALFNISRKGVSVKGNTADLFTVGFGAQAKTDAILHEAKKKLEALTDIDLGLALIKGPTSPTIAMLIANFFVHHYGATAYFEQTLDAYVVVLAHGSDRKVGDLIPASDVITL